jgi:hypothetical protein
MCVIDWNRTCGRPIASRRSSPWAGAVTVAISPPYRVARSYDQGGGL